MEVRGTKGLKSNMHSEIETLESKAYKAGHRDGYNEARNKARECSWEKGVTDTLAMVRDFLKTLSEDEDLPFEGKAAATALLGIASKSDEWFVETVREFNEYVNKLASEEDSKSYVPEVGDVILDPAGNECAVTNTDRNIHVIYTENGKTCKWSKDTKFKKVGNKSMVFGKVIGAGTIDTELSNIEQ